MLALLFANNCLTLIELYRYTVNLVVFFVDKQLPELPDRTNAVLFLPLSKNSKTKEENHKLLNGNSGDPAEWI